MDGWIDGWRVKAMVLIGLRWHGADASNLNLGGQAGVQIWSGRVGIQRGACRRGAQSGTQEIQGGSPLGAGPGPGLVIVEVTFNPQP